MDTNHKREQGHGSSNKSKKRPESNFKGNRDVEVSKNPKSLGVEKPILFQLGSIASYGVSNYGPKKDQEKTDAKKITKPLSSSSSSSTPSDNMIEINSKDENSKQKQPRLSVSSTPREYQVSVVTHATLSPTQSPEVQVMDRGGYDPHRIPSTVFSGNAGLDWSETSNESLFSLNNIGTTSLARDLTIQHKSGELLKSGELITLPVNIEDTLRRISDTEEKKTVEFEVKTARIDSEEKPSTPVVSWTTHSNSDTLYQTPTSMQSLSSFPITKKNKKKKNKQKKTKTKKKKKMCCGWAWLTSCFHCNDKCCTNPKPCCSCFRWPRCSCRYSACCSCLKWLFCCRWNCCSSLSGEVTDEQMGTDPTIQATEQPKARKSSLYYKWFYCFSTRCWCCSCRSCSCC